VTGSLSAQSGKRIEWFGKFRPGELRTTYGGTGGTVGDVNAGGLFLLCIADKVNADGVSLDWSARYRFTG